MNRIHITGWVVKEHRGAWLFELGFVSGRASPGGYRTWLPKSLCRVERRSRDLIHLSVPLWLHRQNERA